MINRRAFFLAAGAPLFATRAGVSQTAPTRLARKDSFLGMHFDLHPNPHDMALGRDVTDEMVEHFLNEVKPDYVQYDCKGHVGYLGYPSQVGTSAPHIVKDSLEIWRRVTARHGVALYIHFSGVWDSRAIAEHPEWASVHADGARDPNATSTFGPYVDRLMIPELEEAARKYDLDGVWVDGECWAVSLDYGEAAARAFREATGVRDLPKSEKDAGWQDFLEFQRARFRGYVRHYVETLHRTRPKFQIASNWLYTTFVPERPDLPVDYLSGDYLGNASISTARLEGRYLASVGKPWDLMAWGFQNATPKTGPSHKPAVQLQQEAAVILAQGGGFQIYYQPTRSGKLDERHIQVMAKVARFCRDRQALSHRTRSVPQIGLLFSTTSLYTTVPKMFGAWGAAVDPARGFLDVLVDNQYSVDVIPEWRLGEVIASYPLLVVPDWPNIGANVKQVVADYVRAGGKALLAGARNAALFANELGVRLPGSPGEQDAFLVGDETFGEARGLWQAVEPASAQVLAERYPTYDATRDGACAATLHRYGSGEIAAIYGPMGTIFAATHAAATRQFVRRIVERLFVPAVRVEGPPTVEVALRRKDADLLVHLVNCTAMQVAADYIAGDYIPPVGPLALSVALPGAPARVTLEPEQLPLAGSYANGQWSGTVPRLNIHSIVRISPAFR
ncbi:MAG TPA: hypothetical protein VFA33_00715 [Bryobacteraceae bacterium]|nr:hypothetical protein [Bryobacteraceae bacterium]